METNERILQAERRKQAILANNEGPNDPRLFLELSPTEQTAIVEWLHRRFTQAKRRLPMRTSYGIKHSFAAEGGFYVYNGVMKGALLQAGFKIVNPEEMNWSLYATEKRGRKKQ